MSRKLCIHGHFYQPPREDPWLGGIFIEPSAAPMQHWNERIVRESYAPIGWARRLDGSGRIADIMNCYAWISFNAGPTLLTWLERRDPETYARILEADAISSARWGHGNAIAQIYHHSIMPLASRQEKEVETAWAIADFESRFKRRPEGMWLSECAVDTATLEVLAEEGIRFVILAPRQAEAVALPSGGFRPAEQGGPDIRQPYEVMLPSGSSIAVFFYHGPLSQGIAFEGLLKDGERFWDRIREEAGEGLLSLSTDGETYGHHCPFGEMALAYVLAQGIAGRDGITLCNYSAYLAENPPKQQVRLHEPSSWSCAHGVERWRSDCGCTDGGHPEWNQKWRAPLRSALTRAKEAVDAHFSAAGGRYFHDSRQALREYGAVLADPACAAAFIARHAPDADMAAQDALWKLLAMQEHALAAFASCAWFFDDISRIEPVNGMTYMLRAGELALDTGGPDILPILEKELAAAWSNKPEEGNGVDILRVHVLPRRQDAASLTLMALVSLECDDRFPEAQAAAEVVWPRAAASIRPGAWNEAQDGERGGTAFVRTALEKEGRHVAWRWLPPSRRSEAEAGNAFVPLAESEVVVSLDNGTLVSRKVSDLPRHVRDYLALSAIARHAQGQHSLMAAAARHAVSLLSPLEEGQTSLPCFWDWIALGPYVILACVTEEKLEEAVRHQTAAFLSGTAAPPAAQEKAARLIEQALLEELAHRNSTAPESISGLASWVRRARSLLPGITWWRAQNRVWGLGVCKPEYLALAEELGFRTR